MNQLKEHSLPSGKIYCEGRKTWVSCTPEEIVRQRLISELTTSLKFPINHIVLEKAVRQMPHLYLSNQRIPDRRVDIVCFAKGIHPKHDLYPLLIIECKAAKLTSKVISQVVGYNHFIKAPFIAVANATEIQFGFNAGQNQYTFIPYIPSYQELILSLSSK